jgi:glucose-6-phosphate isomerase
MHPLLLLVLFCRFFAFGNVLSGKRLQIAIMPFSQASELPAWKTLQDHYLTVKTLHLKDLFAKDPKRAEKFSRSFENAADGNEIFFDFSKNFITDETLDLLVKLAKEAGVEGLRDSMFNGEEINFTEKRAVYHMALRNTSNQTMKVNGISVVEGVNSVLEHMKEFSEQVRSGEWKGHTGKPIKSIVNIGIGGSDLYECLYLRFSFSHQFR